METQTRYDLNAAIENWRAELAAQPNLTVEVRCELETHLRDAIAGFQQRGLNDEESFWLACKRVGQPPQLGEEFEKADPAKIWRERIFWMWLALFLSCTLGSVGSSFAFAVTPNTSKLWLIMQIATVLFTIFIPLMLAILLAKGKLVGQFSKLMRLVENRRRLATAALACIFISSAIRLGSLAIFYFRGHLPVSNTTWFAMTIPHFVYAFIAGLILIWLMPPQNQKAPKRA